MSRNDYVALITIGALIAVVVATIVFWLAGSESMLVSGLGASIAIAFGRLAGLALMLLVFCQVLLASRMPLLDAFPSFSAPRMHRLCGFSILGMIVIHVCLLVGGYAARDHRGVFEQCSVFITTWDNVVYALVGAVVILAIGIMSIRAVRTLFRYELWYAFHLFLYGAIAFSFMHQISSGDMADSLARTYWTTLALLVGCVFLWYRVFRPLWYVVWHDFRIARVVRESDTVVSIYITGRHMRSFRFKAGQYAHFMFLQRGLCSHHPFSFSQPYNGIDLRVSIKKLGDFTNTIENLVPGTRVIIDGPMGHFTCNLAETGRFCFVAGGIGITPIVAMIRDLARPADAVAFVANKMRSDTPLIHELMHAGVQVHTYVSDVTPAQKIDASEIIKTCPDVFDRDVFLCGPPGMVIGITNELVAAGVPTRHIHSEGFSY